MMRLAIMLGALALLAGCERAKQDMYDQPRYKPFAASALFADGASARNPPAGTQPRARGAFADSSGGRQGTQAVATDIAAERAQANPYPVDLALLKRGQERYTIYCMPCHSPAGDGDGLIVRRGFPPPPSYHQDRLRNAPDRHLYDVISKGYGVMVPYGDRVEPADRWAIVAYIRALQLAEHATASALPAGLRAKLADADAGDSTSEPAPAAIAQPNQQQAAPPEVRPLPPPADGGGAAQPGMQAPAAQPIPQTWPGRTAPVLPTVLEQRAAAAAEQAADAAPGHQAAPETGRQQGQGRKQQANQQQGQGLGLQPNQQPGPRTGQRRTP